MKQVEFEQKKWNDFFLMEANTKAESVEGYKKPNLWRQICDDDFISILQKYLNTNENIKVVEPGCGSGLTAFSISNFYKNIEITLCDISENALKVAKKNEPLSLKNKVQYHECTVDSMPISSDFSDLTWNIGVLEHYSLSDIEPMVKEMLRITKPGGYVIIGIPNRNSIATLKAALLGSNFGLKFLSKIPGYRFDSEILYGNGFFEKALTQITNKKVQLEFSGSLLWVNAPEFFVRLINKLFPKTRMSFLSFFVIKK